ncbi:MAG: hypothetical protein ABI232_05280 [Jatrophihabitantaceae bacterium]
MANDSAALLEPPRAAKHECISADKQIPGAHRFHTHDAFGNRLEYQQA